MTEREFELSRRDLLRYAAQGAALLGTGGMLATGNRRITRSSCHNLGATHQAGRDSAGGLERRQ